MYIVVNIIVSGLLFIGTALSYEFTLNFDNCYTYNIHNTNEDESYLVSWDGDSISSYSCKIGFHGYDNASPLNEYKVCIRATTWNIQNTEVRLKYYTGLSDVLVKTYSYYAYDDPTTEWCSDSGEYVDIELTAPDVNDGDNKIILEVRGVRTYDFANTLGFIIGGAIGGVLLITLVCIVLVVLVFRRRSPPMAGYVNQGYPNIPAPPPYYGTTKNVQTGYEAQNYQDQPSYQQYPVQSSSQQTTTTSNSQSQQSGSQEQSNQST
ncbi:uncharacterized protein [Mytilus edulis]|uniref:uncharacterized protein n=1 Tax=Mytilus edulis TaxID=6550 RepID=UPI0039EF7B4F